MRFDTKIAIAVREDLATWQKLNVTAFLASAVAGGRPEVIGERYQDGSGHLYLPMFRQPVLIYAADAQALSDAHGRALARPPRPHRGRQYRRQTRRRDHAGHSGRRHAPPRRGAPARCRPLAT